MDATRLAMYVAGLVASLLALLGLADFDIASGMFTPHPFNIYEVVIPVVTFVSSAVATVAWLLGLRGRKK